ncbi:unnamed protein product [Linum tenue]|uniref:SET domain-containing protein n=1 Tax=Linum tenue TaxID=586396 RepID=A0AAV0HML8_9ROSI|nr:unnamed protein product [Linum tenue]
MPVNPRVLKVFQTMGEMGFTEDVVKPILKRLLKLYNKKISLIEEDNYRVLLDALLEEQEASGNKKPVDEESFEEDAQDEEPPPRPLKRLRPLRLRDQEGMVSPSSGNHCPQTNGTLLKQPKREDTDPPSTSSTQRSPSPQHAATSTASQPSSAQRSSSQQQVTDRIVPSEQCLPQKQLVNKGKKPMSSQGPARDKRHLASGEKSIRLGSPLKRKLPDISALIVPKDEPVTEEMPLNELPLAVIGPDSSNGNTADLGDQTSMPSSNLEIASSPSGEVKISLSCQPLFGRPDFHMPTLDELLKSVEEKSLRHKLLDPNFSLIQLMKDMCQCFVELATDSSHESQERGVISETHYELKNSDASTALCLVGTDGNNEAPSDVSVDPEPQVPKLVHSLSKHVIPNGGDVNGFGSRSGDPESCSLAVVPRYQTGRDELRSLHDSNDITKGEEVVEIPWVNEVNNECPPSFHYIPGNLVFQNAYVKFTLSQITEDHCCTSCIGNCLSSSSPCVCVAETLYGFAYTPDGLLKDDFLQECISMTRDPQLQSISSCMDCPLERSRNEEMLEPCKGHLNRKFIKECWRKCGCHKQCGNRVVQRGIRRKLQVFFTTDGKGWGLKTLEKLPKGAFVCEYIGEILTIKERHERTMQNSSITKTENPPSVLLDAYWNLKEALKDEEYLCLDASFYSNVARFINHRCLDANLIEIPVKIETPDHHYYHLAFFTTREVDALEELTWVSNFIYRHATGSRPLAR